MKLLAFFGLLLAVSSVGLAQCEFCSERGGRGWFWDNVVISSLIIQQGPK